MSTVRIIIEGTVNDYEAFSSLAKEVCEMIEEQEPGTLAHEWFADQISGAATLHELYEDADAFLTHFENVTESGMMDRFLSCLEIERVISLNRITDPRVQDIAEQFGAAELHGVAGVVR